MSVLLGSVIEGQFVSGGESCCSHVCCGPEIQEREGGGGGIVLLESAASCGNARNGRDEVVLRRGCRGWLERQRIIYRSARNDAAASCVVLIDHTCPEFTNLQQASLPLSAKAEAALSTVLAREPHGVSRVSRADVI